MTSQPEPWDATTQRTESERQQAIRLGRPGMSGPLDPQNPGDSVLHGLAAPIPAPRGVGRKLLACPVCHKRFGALSRYSLHYRMNHDARRSR
jgi:hypothetical protein